MRETNDRDRTDFRAKYTDASNDVRNIVQNPIFAVVGLVVAVGVIVFAVIAH